MSLVKMHNKKTGVTYVYESRSYWDKEKKQPRNERKLIGKLDPVTGEIIPTRKPANPHVDTGTNTECSVNQSKLEKVITEKDELIAELELKIKTLEIRCRRNEETMDRIRSMIERTMNESK